ncbi:SAM-dependent methyltransferase [Rhodobium orientis]|nr:class I SAM-dependent methyltransferase [Rhodobium orientis]MBB4301255.1 SAM-dependent methyltransferase [Rhodobium orientis]
MSVEIPSLTGLPTVAEPTSAMEVIELGFGQLDGQSILDIGCGKGALAAALIERGATITGLDPNEIALEEAKKAAPEAEFHLLSGAELPYEDGAFDGAIFLNSLHHIPEADMTTALAEAARVCGAGTTVVVVEPVADGSYFSAVRLIDDETEVRAKAQEAIAAAVDAGLFALDLDTSYERVSTFADKEAFLERVVSIDPARRERGEAKRAEVFAALDANGDEGPDGITLIQPMRAQILTVL